MHFWCLHTLVGDPDMRGFGHLSLFVMLAACHSDVGGENPDADLDRLKAVNDAYEAAWLAGDSAAVLRMFEPDAVLLPHHGDPPIVGLDAIRAFWWPRNAPPTTVTALDITTDGAALDRRHGTLWGRFALAFSLETKDGLHSGRNVGTYLMVLRRQSNGEWRITHRMWGDPVPRQN